MKKKLLIIGLFLTLFAAGCGDSGSLTKAEFVEQADAICKEASKEQQAAFAKLSRSEAPASDANAVAREYVTEVVIPANQKQIDEIEDLGAPSGNEQQVEAMLAAMQRGLDEAKQEPPLKFVQTESTLQKGRSMAGRYGLKACT